MRRDASREGLLRFRAALRSRPGLVPTLWRLQREYCWLWLHCDAPGCHHHAPAAIAPFVIRWGFEASSDMLRRSARCSRCGHKGASTTMPSYVDVIVRFAPFPSGDG